MDRKLIEEFITASHEIKRLVDKKSDISYEDRNVSKLQFFTLNHILKTPGITVGKLAERLFLSSGAIAQLIERLVYKGWIYKEVDENDKRVFHLYLSELGEEELKKMKDVYKTKIKAMLELLSDDDIQVLLSIEKRLITELKKKEVC